MTARRALPAQRLAALLVSLACALVVVASASGSIPRLGADSATGVTRAMAARSVTAAPVGPVHSGDRIRLAIAPVDVIGTFAGGRADLAEIAGGPVVATASLPSARLGSASARGPPAATAA